MTFFTRLIRPATLWLLALAALPCAAAAQGVERPAFGLIVGYRDAADDLRREDTDRGPWAGGRERAQAAWQQAVKRSRERTERLAKDTGVKVKSVGEAGRSALMRFDKPLKGATLADAMRRVRLHPDVAWVEPDVLVKRQAVPNDLDLNLQWYLNAPATEIAGMNLPLAWDLSTGTNIVVAVVDNGVRPAHPDLAGKLVAGYDFISELSVENDSQPGRDNDPTDPGDFVTAGDLNNPTFNGCVVSDSSWHGTFIAGQIGAATANGVGIAGINWTARIQPVRVSGKCGALVSDLLDGARWAAGLPVDGVGSNPTPARVINLSFGGDAACSPAYQSMVDDVRDAGALLVVAAGNNDGALKRPADCDGVMAVASVTRDGFKADYSSFGANIALSAPGGSGVDGLYGLDNGSTTVPGANTYGEKQGTSFSAPQAAGVASLMLAINPNLTPSALIDRMKASARSWATVVATGTACGPALAGECKCTINTCGAGLLDARKALEYASGPAAIIDRIGTVLPGALITLDGTGSVPVTGSITQYQWTQVSGPSVTIPTGTQPTTSVRLPTVESRFEFKLTVTDGGAPGTNTGTDTVTVVAAYPPSSGGGGSMGWWWGAGLWAWVLGALVGFLRRR